MEMESEDLGWLEADLDLHDDYIDEDFESPLPEEEASIEQVYEHHQPEPITKPNLSIPDDHITDLETETSQPKKRLLNPSFLDSTDFDDSVEDKRCRVDLGVNEADDEWMRYSPVREEAAVVVEDVTEEKERFISRFATDVDGDFMPVTAPDGDRVYAKLVKEEVEDKVKKLEVTGRFEGLMREPISVLMQKVEQKELQKALEASVSTQIDTDLLETPVVTEQLWVDKYSPNSFVELLSDEHTNREVLMWLKPWDSSVFGTEVKSTTDDVLSALKRHSSVSQQKKVYSKSNFGRSKEFVPNSGTFGERNHFNNENYDSHATHELHNKKIKDSGPPEQKILLLCGAPGLGKTTLAHVAAGHCGYRVVEVIDEIDGALGDGKGAVDVILKMVAADKKSDTGTENNIQSQQSGKTSSKKKRKDTLLLRPVICICNDLYAPALRPLRNVAKVHVFVQPTVNRIVNRLKYICNKEGMRTSSVALTALNTPNATYGHA